MTTAKALPDSKAIADAYELDVLNSKGEKVKFGSLFKHEKAIVVFIRTSEITPMEPH